MKERPELTRDGNSRRPEVTRDGNSSRPEVTRDGNSSRPELTRDGNSSRPELTRDGNSSRPEVTRDGNSSSGKVEYVDPPLAFVTSGCVVWQAVRLRAGTGPAAGGSNGPLILTPRDCLCIGAFTEATAAARATPATPAVCALYIILSRLHCQCFLLVLGHGTRNGDWWVGQVGLYSCRFSCCWMRARNFFFFFLPFREFPIVYLWLDSERSSNLGMAFVLSLALDPTFGIHSHKTLDTAQPCHLLKPN